MTQILIVEDDLFLLKIKQAKLIQSGYEVFTAHDGEEALQILETHTPDIIILDVAMPILNGFDTLQRIRNTEKYTHIPIIILTNLNQDSDIKRGMDLGATDYLVKSNVSVDDVIARIKKYTK
jgi:DNA-binding response OmpR family regulator